GLGALVRNRASAPADRAMRSVAGSGSNSAASLFGGVHWIAIAKLLLRGGSDGAALAGERQTMVFRSAPSSSSNCGRPAWHLGGHLIYGSSSLRWRRSSATPTPPWSSCRPSATSLHRAR